MAVAADALGTVDRERRATEPVTFPGSLLGTRR